MSETVKVLLVYSTSHAIKIEKMLKAGGIPCKLVPVPRHLSSDCGICVRFGSEDETAVRAAVETSEIETPGIFAL